MRETDYVDTAVVSVGVKRDPLNLREGYKPIVTRVQNFKGTSFIKIFGLTAASGLLVNQILQYRFSP